jgi:hypothetical protein
MQEQERQTECILCYKTTCAFITLLYLRCWGRRCVCSMQGIAGPELRKTAGWTAIFNGRVSEVSL